MKIPISGPLYSTIWVLNLSCNRRINLPEIEAPVPKRTGALFYTELEVTTTCILLLRQQWPLYQSRALYQRKIEILSK